MKSYDGYYYDNLVDDKSKYPRESQVEPCEIKFSFQKLFLRNLLLHSHFKVRS